MSDAELVSCQFNTWKNLNVCFRHSDISYVIVLCANDYINIQTDICRVATSPSGNDQQINQHYSAHSLTRKQWIAHNSNHLCTGPISVYYENQLDNTSV